MRREMWDRCVPTSWRAFSWQLDNDTAQRPRRWEISFWKLQEKKKGRISWCMLCIFYKHTDYVQCLEPHVVVWLSPLMQPASHVVVSFLHSIHQGKRGGEDTQGYTNTKLHSEERRWKERPDFCVTESVKHKSFWAFVYVGPVFHSSTPTSALNKTQLYEFTPICTIWTDYPLFWHVADGDLGMIRGDASWFTDARRNFAI